MALKIDQDPATLIALLRRAFAKLSRVRGLVLHQDFCGGHGASSPSSFSSSSLWGVWAPLRVVGFGPFAEWLPALLAL